MTTQTFSVSGMKCPHCQANVEGALLALAGVASAQGNLSEASVTVQYDETLLTPGRLKEAVDGAGRYELTL